MILNFCMPLDYFFDSDTGRCSSRSKYAIWRGFMKDSWGFMKILICDTSFLRTWEWFCALPGIVRVDVSIDEGNTWVTAELLDGKDQPYNRAWAWTFWEASATWSRFTEDITRLGVAKGKMAGFYWKESCSLKSLEKIIWTTIADVQQYPWRVAARTGLRYYRNVTDISIREHPAFKNPISVVEVPVPDALKGKDITILCRAVDSAYSTSSRVFGVSMCLFLGRIDGLCMVIWYMVQ